MTENRLKDEELICLIQSKSRKGAEALYNAYAHFIMLVVIRNIRCSDDANEIIRQVFLEVWNNINDFPAGEKKMSAWVKEIAKEKTNEFTYDKKT